MRNSTIKSFAYGVALTASAIAGLVFAAKASADFEELSAEQNTYVNQFEQYICGSVIGNPSPRGVYNTLQMVVNDGWTGYEAGEIVAAAVIDACPAQLPVLQDFIDVATAATGGTV